MIERVIEFCARQRFLVFAIVVFVAAWGLWALVNSPLDAIPDLSDTQVIVYTEWPGRSPDLVEDQITYPIVSALLAAPRVQVVRGLSDFGFSYVYVIFEEGTDVYWARSRVVEYLGGIRGQLPEAVEPRLGPDASAVGWLFQYALVDETGQTDLQQLRSFQDWHLRFMLESLDGVAEVASVGGFVKQYQVNVDPNRLLAYNMPLSRIVDAIRRSNSDVGGRSLDIATTEFMVRGRGYIESLADLENVPLGVSDTGTPIFVRDIGHVQLGPDMRRGVAELDGRGEVVGGIVIARYNQNALDVIQRVRQRLAEIEPALPPGVQVVTTYDRSDLILGSIRTMSHVLTEEMLVVSLMIVIFLLHLRTALVPIVILPLAVILSFIPMYYMGLTANIMSLGGIAVAIGAMVDAAVVLVENAHKRLDQWEEQGRPGPRVEVLISSFKEVGRTIFFALLVITVSFLPVFTLQAQEGRLFTPLAYTKTFSMFFAAILAISLVPALGVLLIRGRIRSESRHPISRALHAAYSPVLSGVTLRYPKTVIVAAVLVTLSTIPVFTRLGSEFMPPLNEGTILFMPTAVPGMPIAEAARLLQIQDRILSQIPEVERVFGKIGRAGTSTDSAPLSMVETTILLKPQREWRTVRRDRWHSGRAPESLAGWLARLWPEERPMTWDELIDDMDPQVKFPGMANIWWMPVQTRTEMLNTGIRSNLGIKVFGDDLNRIEEVAVEIERVLTDVPGTRSVFADRVTGGYFLDFKVERERAARYGLTVQDVQDVIEAAIGGKPATYTVEGRERYPVSVRYLRELRDDPARLGRVLIPTPVGAHVPISLLANMSFTTGPSMIRNENAQLVGYVFVDVAQSDYVSYVQQASEIVSERVALPPGYRLEWAGQYENILRMNERLRLVVPLTLFLVFFLFYLNFKDWRMTGIVLLSVPFSLIGAFWLLYLLDYNMSMAVWVGIIALAGIAAETGAVMLLYLDLAYKRWKSEGRLRNLANLRDAIHYGAVQRVRPKAMTVGTTMIGLMPLMLASSMEPGADVMKRIAAPMVGGLVTSFILVMFIYPAIFAVWKGRADRLEEPPSEEGGGAVRPTATSPPQRGTSSIWKIIGGLAAAFLAITLALAYWGQPPAVNGGVPIHQETQGGVIATLRHPQGGFQSGRNTFELRFVDAATGQPADVRNVRLQLFMAAMGAMAAMTDTSEVTPAGPGAWRGQIDVSMQGEWLVTIEYEGPSGPARIIFPVRAR